MEKLGGAVLGIPWSASSDKFCYQPAVNVTPRRRGKPTGGNLTEENLHELDPATLVRRTCLSVTNMWLDYLGHCTPITIQLKCAAKRLFSPLYGLGWDDPIPKEEQEGWKRMLEMLVKSPPLEFKRSVILDGDKDEYYMVAYFDGSNEAFSCAIYVVYIGSEGNKNRVQLLASKARVAQEWEVNTVRMELSGAVMMTRVTLRALRAVHKKPMKLWLVGDSETVLAIREKDSGYFREWYSNRIGESFDNQRLMEEIVPIGEKGEWFHVASEDNAADRPSRLDSTPQDIMEGSEWQEGPKYLKENPDSWPFERLFAEKKKQATIEVPKSEIKKRYRDLISTAGEMVSMLQLEQAVYECHRLELTEVVEDGYEEYGVLNVDLKDNDILELLQHGYITNSWEKLIRITSMLFKWSVKPDGRNVAVEMKNKAVHFWMKVAAIETKKAHAEGKLKNLTLYEHDDILVVSGRAEAGLKLHYGVSYLPVLMSSTRTAQLVMLWAHEQEHLGRDLTLSTSYQWAWVVGGRTLAGGICSCCVRCRYLAKKMEGQKMAKLHCTLVLQNGNFRDFDHGVRDVLVTNWRNSFVNAFECII